ncbi:MAG: sulfatase [Akkermansiaceae bacterium]|nr:sulfatase [Akkermansiaceae bacterium]
MKTFLTLGVILCAPVLSAAKPNIVLFLVDDMGWMDSEPYGSQYYETPHMSRLAKQSMRFTDAYALPLCSPCRASILSGQYSSRHGVTSATGHRPPAEPGASRYPERAAANKKFIYPGGRNYLDPALVTLAEVLREAGYRTGHFGKWHLGLTAPHRPDRHGFETTWHCAPDPGPPSYFSPYRVHPDGRPTAQHKVGNITDGPEGEYITDRLTDEALEFIEAHRDEPFFLNLWQYGVHGPWGHKEEYTRVFAKKKDPRGEQRNPIMASMLKSVDESLGRVMDKLDDLGIAGKTLFIFYSDNGGNTHSNVKGDRKLAKVRPGHPKYGFVQDWRKWAGPEAPTNNAPLREGKGRIYEGGQRVPLMVRWPGRIEAGSTSNAVVGPIDLYPTILAALGVAPPQGHVIDGVSFLPVLEQKGGLGREALFTWFPHIVPAVSVRAGEFKLIRRWEPHPGYPDVRELYDLRKDIGETTNLAAKMPAKVKELDRLIDRFIAETGALAPKPNPAYQPGAAGAAGSPAAGLVPKMCTATVMDGALRVEADGRTPFLGTAQVKMTGPLTAKLRLRGMGPGRIQWMTRDQEEFPKEGQSVPFTLTERDAWQEVELQLPVKGTTRLVRLYLPAADGRVDIQSIEYADRSGQSQTWNFAGPAAAK